MDSMNVVSFGNTTQLYWTHNILVIIHKISTSDIYIHLCDKFKIAWYSRWYLKYICDYDFNLFNVTSNISKYVHYIQIHFHGFKLYHKKYADIFRLTDIVWQGNYILLYLDFWPLSNYLIIIFFYNFLPLLHTFKLNILIHFWGQGACTD